MRSRAPTPDGTTRRRARSFRPDIEGLRAVAVVGVLLYHAGVPLFSGGYLGVDVFFVISGFLITGLLVKELSTTGNIRIGRFFARRVKRLLPLALVVLAAVAMLSAWLADPVERPEIGRDIAFAGFYALNWRLASTSVDYSADRLEASPLQHFWTLGVEEQFYVVWPALLLAAALWWRLRGGNLRLMLAVPVGAVAVGSLVYAQQLTVESADVAYFSTFARGWELALGALLALLLWHPPRLPRALRLACGAAGLCAVVACMFVYDDATLFPGAAALVPTLGVAAVILAGTGDESTVVSRALSLPPVRHVGRISYAWYLWHWPALLFAGMAWGELSLAQSLLVVAAAYVPTVLTHHWLERPLHHSRGRWTRPTVALPIGVAISVSAVLIGSLVSVTTPTVRLASQEQTKGAQVLPQQQSPQRSADALRPDPKNALGDSGRAYKRCLVARHSTRLKDDCVYGDPRSSTTVLLFGDSHALQYAAAMTRIARREGWRLVVLGKAGCPTADVSTFNDALRREYAECPAWLDKAVRKVARERPELLVTSTRTDYDLVEDGETLDRSHSDRALRDGYAALLSRLRNVQRIAVIAENPHLGDVPGCVAENLRDLDRCAMPREKATDFAPVTRYAARHVPEATLVDPMRFFCPEVTCPAVIGNVLVYRGDNHLTATYARSLAPWLRRQLTVRLPRSEAHPPPVGDMARPG